jgi:hypothetical protein
VSTANVLRMAKNVLRERGWCQGDYVCDGKVCARGAINAAVTGDPEKETGDCIVAFSFMENLLGCADLAEWNDCWDREEPEVFDAFDKAIAAAEVSK